MRGKLVLVIRLVLGAIFTLFGLNGFLHFLSMPPMPAQAGALMGALAQSGYMLPMIMGCEVLGGVLLLSGCWVPLALLLLAPVVVNILLFHLFLAPSGLPLAFFVVAAEAFLAWSYRGRYAPLFIRK